MMTGMFDKRLNSYTSVTGSTMLKDITRTYAGKSGSTNADRWMIGFSPQLVSAVWTGYDDGKSLELTIDKGLCEEDLGRFYGKSIGRCPSKVI